MNRTARSPELRFRTSTWLALLVLVLPSASANGQESCPDCQSRAAGSSAEAKKIENLASSIPTNTLPWWSASEAQIRNAPCRRKAPFTDSEIEKGIQALIPKNDTKVTKNLYGLQLENQSAYLVGLLDKLLRYEDVTMSESERKESQKTFTSSCKTVLCAVKDPKIFGPKLGPRLLYMLGRYGHNGSSYATFNSDPWSASEINDILMAMSDFPPSALPFSTNQQITHFKRGYTMAMYGADNRVVANAFIFVFDTWNEVEKEHRQSSIVHEIAHNFGSQYHLDDSDAWLGFSSWSERTRIEGGEEVTTYRLGKPQKVISEYGQTNPQEDFAESVVAYRYNPRALKARSPEKYQFLKEAVFDGLEYTSATACHPSKAASRKLSDQAQSIASAHITDEDQFTQLLPHIYRRCGSEIFRQFDKDYRLTSRHLSSVRACIDEAASQLAITQSPEMRKLKYPAQTQKPTVERVRNLKLDDLSSALVQIQVFKRTRESFVDFITRLEDKADLDDQFLTEKKSTAEFCKDLSTLAYLDAATIDSVFGSDGFFAFKNKKFLEGFAHQVCLDLHRGEKTPTAKDANQIEAAVGRRFLSH